MAAHAAATHICITLWTITSD